MMLIKEVYITITTPVEGAFFRVQFTSRDRSRVSFISILQGSKVQ